MVDLDKIKRMYAENDRKWAQIERSGLEELIKQVYRDVVVPAEAYKWLDRLTKERAPDSSEAHLVGTANEFGKISP